MAYGKQATITTKEMGGNNFYGRRMTVTFIMLEETDRNQGGGISSQ